MIRIGTKVRLDPLYGLDLDKYNYQKPNYTTGKVVYINRPHNWFMVEYVAKETGVTLYRGYKFDDLDTKYLYVC